MVLAMSVPEPPVPATPPPPYAIRTANLHLRCYEPRDAETLRVVSAANKEHLAPWMPWAKLEPQTLEEKAALVRRFRGSFDLGHEFVYGIFEPDDGPLVGGCGLHRRSGPGTLEIGYWIDKDHIGSGFATEAASALTQVGFEIARARRIDIRVEPENTPSNRVAEKLGYRREGVLRSRLRWTDGVYRDSVYWSLLATEYPETPSKGVQLEAFDFLGWRIL